MGEFMGYLPLTVTIALLASLFVALVINPTLCAAFMRVKPGKVFERGRRPVGRFMRVYRGFLKAAVRYRKSFALGAFAILFLMIWTYVKFGEGMEFMPSTEPKNAQIDIRLPEGTSIDATDRVAGKIEKVIREVDTHNDIQYMVTNIGTKTSMMLGSSAGSKVPHVAQISLEFKDLDKRKEKKSTKIIKNIRERLTGFAGVELKVTKQQEGPPTGAPISVEIHGEDYDLMDGYARKAKDIIRNIPGAVDVKDDLERGRPELRVQVDRTRASLLNLDSNIVGTTIKTAYFGSKVGTFMIGDDEYDIRIIAPKRFRKGFHMLDKLYISTFTGSQVPASTVAKWGIVGASGVIRRVDQKRVVTVSGDVADGFSKAEVREKIKAALAKEFAAPFPEGYGYRLTGEEKFQKEASEFLSQAFAIAIMLVALVLISQFNSITIPLIILSSILLSLAGVFSGLLVVGHKFVIIMTGVGIISLVGVVVNNAIVLIDYIQKLRMRGLSVTDALVQAGMTRLRPVLLTAVTTILGLMPMAAGVSFDFSTGRFAIATEMSQWWGSMAVAVIFGLAFATLLTLIMVPTFYYLIHNAKHVWRRRIRRKRDSESFGVFVSSLGILKSDVVEEAARKTHSQGRDLHDVLAGDEYLGSERYLSLLSDFTNFPVWGNLSKAGMCTNFKALVPRETAEKYKMAAFCSTAKLTIFGPIGEPDVPCEADAYTRAYYLALADPFIPGIRERIQDFAAKCATRVIPVLAPENEISSLIERTYTSEYDV
jgi:multidrug efflux pump subunit AcrB